MYQIDVSTAASTQPASTALGTPGFFTDGNAAQGVAATVVPAEYLNSLMMELINVVEGAGIALNKSAFNQLYTAIQTIGQSGASNYAADAGVSNAYAVTYAPTVQAPADGMVRAFKVKNTNTGASTFALDGSTTTYPIYGLNGSPLQGGELTANGIAVIRFNAALSASGAWVLYHCGGSPMQIAPATKSNHATQSQQVQSSAHVYAPDTGAANAYAASFVPAIAAVADGLALRFKAAHANTGASTFTPNNGVIASAPIYGGDHAALTGGEIVLNGECEVTWNSSLNSAAGAWVLTESSGGYVKAATPPQFDATTKGATMAAVQAALGNYSNAQPVASTSLALTAAYMGQAIVAVSVASAGAWTMPALSSVPFGASIRISNLTGYALAINQQNSGDKFIGAFNSAGTANSFSIPLWTEVTIVKYQANIWLVIGLADFVSSPLFSASFAEPGYQKFPSGFTVQWNSLGITANTGTTPETYTLPLAFQNACLGVVCSLAGAIGTGEAVAAAVVSKSQIALYNPQSGAQTVWYFAWGY